MSGCFENDTLVAFASGALHAERLPEIESHLDECRTCRAAVAAVVHSQTDDTETPPAPGTLTLLAPGTHVGRYQVESVAGAGGMGVIYRAFDPTLNRHVALKLVRSDLSYGAGAERLLLEAKAMARVVHPEVMPVYDAGVFGEQLFIAMEWVEGHTLRAELKAGTRTVRDIIRLFSRAGKGLAAAHRAGLVHRDFKPENVLIGHDGRIRVTDFGLAHEVTQSTSLEGTLAYMAPEVLRGEPATAAADQYAFSVALFEALSGKRVTSHFDQVPLRGSGSLRRAILRGLSPSPGLRHSSMDALVTELERIERPTRGWQLAASLLVVSGVALFFGVRFSQANRCTGGEAKIAPVWNADRRAKVLNPASERDRPTAERVAQMLDAYVRDWTQAHTAACRLTRVTQEQSEQVLDLKIACLDQNLAAVGALINALEQQPAWDKAPEATAETTSLGRCGNSAFLMAQDPSRQAGLPVARKLQQATAAVQQFKFLGPFEEGRRRAESVLAEAVDAGVPTLEAEAHLLTAEFLRKLRSKPEQGAAIDEHLEQAVLAGTRARFPHVVAEAWLEKMRSCIDDARFQEAERAWEHGVATLEGLGQDPWLETRFALSLGRLRMRQSRLSDALSAYQRAQLKLALLPDDQARRVQSELFEGEALVRITGGEINEGIKLLTRAITSIEANYGPDYPRLGDLFHNLAETERGQGALDDSLKHAQASLRVWRRAYGPKNPRVAVAFTGLADTHASRGELTDARTAINTAKELLDQNGLSKTFISMRALCSEGQVFRAEGDLSQSEHVLLEALKLAPTAAGKYPLDEAECELQLGNTFALAHKNVLARAAYQRALKLYGTTLRGPWPWRVRVAVAELDASEGNTHQAIASLNEALAALVEENVDPTTQSRAREALTRIQSAHGP